jgi:prolyl-tRNA editing enzyme YbaK/EbsC (Cys-tRNA(Pro) deacylase)
LIDNIKNTQRITDNIPKKVVDLIESKEVDAKIVQHESVVTCNDVQEFLNISKSLIVKCILFEDKRKNYVLAVVSGDKTVDLKKVESSLLMKKLHVVDPKQIESITGYPLGAVPPFAHIDNIRIIIDKNLIIQDRLYCGTGNPHFSFILSGESINKLATGVIADIGQ